MNNIDQIRQLRAEAISKNTLNVYLLSISKFLLFLYNYDPSEDHDASEVNPVQYQCPLTPQVKNLIAMNSAETPAKQKKILKEELQKLNRIPVVDCSKLTDHHLMLFIVTTKKPNGDDLTYSALNTHRASFAHLFTMHGQKISEPISDAITLCFKSLKRRAAKKAQDGTAPMITNTKQPLPFTAYQTLALHFMKGSAVHSRQDALSSAFAHVFFLLAWNTMQRAGTTSQISWRQVEWENDCLVIYIHQAKNDQEGDRSHYGRHVYANPVYPVICPILALAIFLSLVENRKLFHGSKQDERFRQFLARSMEVQEVQNAMAELGFDKES